MRDWVEVAPGIRATGDGAAWLPDHRTIVVADLHIGYARAARRRGGYLPAAESIESLANRVLDIIRRRAAEQVVIAGDLRHSTHDVDAGERVEIDRFLTLVSAEATIVVVGGNHDRGDDRTVTSFALGSVTIVHAPPADVPSRWTVCGHLHPSTTVSDVTGVSVRYPCFLVGPNVLVLPAFTEWAGGTRASRFRPHLPEGDWHNLPIHDGYVYDFSV